MKQALRPLRDYVLVELEQDPTEQTITASGLILLPPREEARQSIGRVLAVGPGTYSKKGRFEPTTVRPGDRVAFSKYGHSTPPGQPLRRLFREGSVHYVLE